MLWRSIGRVTILW